MGVYPELTEKLFFSVKSPCSGMIIVLNMSFILPIGLMSKILVTIA